MITNNDILIADIKAVRYISEIRSFCLCRVKWWPTRAEQIAMDVIIVEPIVQNGDYVQENIIAIIVALLAQAVLVVVIVEVLIVKILRHKRQLKAVLIL